MRKGTLHEENSKKVQSSIAGIGPGSRVLVCDKRNGIRNRERRIRREELGRHKDRVGYKDRGVHAHHERYGKHRR